MQMRTRKAASVLAVALVVAAFMSIPSLVQAQTPSKLLITQVEVRGDEYVVIKNPGTSPVDLTDYYITDATYRAGDTYYYNLPNPAGLIGGGSFFDFTARFPEGATIGAGQEISLSITGSDGFYESYGAMPHFELYEDGSVADDVPDMLPARAGSILGDGTQPPTLSNSGEIIILFYWDGESDLVTDIDYVPWGDTDEAVDKTGVAIDGPDADAVATSFQPDTPIASQQIAGFGNPSGVYVRVDDSEGTQKTSGGNGVDGRDETSENLATTFTVTDATPPGQAAEDNTPPTLVSATGDGGSNQVTVTFSESVGAGAGTAGNYEVAPVIGSVTTIAVTAASVNGATVTLTLAENLAMGTGYTVIVNNVQDLAGNAIAADSEASFTTSSPGAFEVAGVFQFGADYVGVAFSDPVNSSQATNAANYSFSPSLSISSVSLQENGQTALIKTSAALPKSASYSLTVTGVTSATGSGLAGSGPFSFQTAAETVLNIATVQTGIATYAGQTVTLIGQVFITGASNGSTPSAYIQDGSGRGINIFGSGDATALNDRGNVTKVTGLVEQYFTTNEITGYTATLVKGGLPYLAPKVLTVAQAQSPSWEGTYIQTTSTLTSAPSASGSTNYNYPADGIIFRIRNAAGISASQYSAGDLVTGAGAGSQYQSDFQIAVGNADDFYKGSGGEDNTPPTLVSATGEAGASSVTVNFSEAVAAGASTASNYTITPSITVNSASASGATVTLTLASALQSGIQYTVRVSNVQDAAGNTIAANSSASFTTGSAGAFEVVDVFQFGKNKIGVAFSERVNSASATQTGNYSISPSISLSGAALQDNGQTVILTTASNLPASSTYTVTVSGVTSQTGGSLGVTSPIGFTTVSGTVVNIADIQTDTATYETQTVTVIGQVYITGSSNGSTPSAYIQDGSGRGINVFGSGTSAPLNDRGNVVSVTGTVEIYFTTIEITGYTATTIAGGIPRLAPKVLTVTEVQSPQWEGTYIQTTSTLTSAPSASGTSNYNYNAEGLVFRVRNGTGINPNDFSSGDTVTGAGAGAQYQTTFQITVGEADDFGKSGGVGDTTPPTLGSASAEAGSNKITVLFSEPVGTGANVTGNYEVFPTASPSAGLTVQSAQVAAATVTLTVGSDLEQGAQYTVRVSNVQDLAGNTIVANSSIDFTVGEAKPTGARLTVPPVTLIKDLRGEGELIPITIAGVAGDRGVLRIFDLQGRLVKVLYDGPIVSAPNPITWDGRDQTYELVRAGTYICHLETTNLAGHVTEDQAPIVVAVRLD